MAKKPEPERNATAYALGFQAFRQRQLETDNPHKLNTLAGQSWFIGWIEAKIEGKFAVPKPWYERKAFWSGVVLVVVSMLGYLSQTVDSTQFPEVAFGLGAATGSLIAGASALGVRMPLPKIMKRRPLFRGNTR